LFIYSLINFKNC